MNPMTNVKNIKKLNEQELRRNLKTSWHDQYKDSAWIFIGGLPFDLTEGDIICVFSQYGEIVNINLVRDKDSGKSRGFCFLCYEDQRSTVLAVDNFNGIKLLGRTLRVDHVANYKAPKDSAKKDAETRRLFEEGCAPSHDSGLPDVKKEKIDDGEDCTIIEQENTVVEAVRGVKLEPKSKKKKKKEQSASRLKVKKEKDSDKKKKRKAKRKSCSSSSDSSSSSESSSSNDESSGSSSEESDSEGERARARKHKHKQAKKKKTKHREDVQEGESAASKRRKLEEKIKALEKALNSVRSGKARQK